MEGGETLWAHGTTAIGRSHRAQRHDLRAVTTPGSRAAVAFTLEQPTEVVVDVLDLQGRSVAQLARETLPAGEYVREWPGPGLAVPSGMYLVRLRTGATMAMVRLPVIR